MAKSTYNILIFIAVNKNTFKYLKTVLDQSYITINHVSSERVDSHIGLEKFCRQPETALLAEILTEFGYISGLKIPP